MVKMIHDFPNSFTSKESLPSKYKFVFYLFIYLFMIGIHVIL